MKLRDLHESSGLFSLFVADVTKANVVSRFGEPLSENIKENIVLHYSTTGVGCKGKCQPQRGYIGPLIDHGLLEGTPEDMKGLPQFFAFLSACMRTSYRSHPMTQKPIFLKIESL